MLISSTMSSRGRAMSARARASICCSPPERLPAVWRRRLPSTGNSCVASPTGSATSAKVEAMSRFSRTDRLGKMPRPSGTWTMPMRAMR